MFSKILLLALPVHVSLAVGSPLQITVSVDEWEGIRMPEDPTQPGWKVENDHFIVPLSDQSRKGLVDPTVEEGVITIAGPRFANELYQDLSGTTMDAASCWGSCALTVVKSLPCIYQAIKDSNPGEALRCVSKNSLCDCTRCFPSPVTKWITKEICRNVSLVSNEGDKLFSPYVDFMAVAYDSISLQAFRGDLYTYRAEELKVLNKRAAGGLYTRDGEVHDMCVVGNACGSCGCCAGVCVLDSCVGACL